MLIARKKQTENIAEYILYMYQIEDLVRAYNFDVEAIITNYVQPQLPDSSFIPQYREWYRQIVLQMKSQRIEKMGHLHDLKDILVEISYLHNTLLSNSADEKYEAVYQAALPFISEFKERSNLKGKNDIELVFHALYMKLLLRLKKTEISAETEEAFDAMRVMLAYLARAYQEMKVGSLTFFNN